MKRKVKVHVYLLVSGSVAFTPKGGCPLKLEILDIHFEFARSIHPQGWVPIETSPDGSSILSMS